jgi:AcrR family transcriptional regulator
MSSEVQNRIVKEALLLFYENGIKVVTMDEIASAMAISKRTIYENFKDKDELLIECLTYNKYVLEKRFNIFFAENKNAIDLLVFFVVVNRKSVVNSSHRFITELKKYHPAVFDFVIKKHEQNKSSVFSNIFKIGIEQGYFRSDVQNEIVFDFIQHGFETIFQNKNPELSDKYSIGEIFEEVLKFCVRGITTEKGMKYYEEKLNNEEFINRIRSLQKETF